jgi:hypothetical protein
MLALVLDYNALKPYTLVRVTTYVEPGSDVLINMFHAWPKIGIFLKSHHFATTPA